MKKWKNLAFVLIITLSILFIGYLKGQKKFQADNFARFIPLELKTRDKRIAPPFDDATVYKIGESIKINGIPTEIHCVETNRSVPFVLTHYKNKWVAHGMDVFTDFSDYSGYAAYFDQQKKYFNIVTIYRDPKQKKTFAFIARSDYHKLPKQNNSFDVTFLPGSQIVFRVEAEDFGNKADTFVLLSDASLASNVNYYRSTMMSKGWKHFPRFYELTARSPNRILMFENDKKECIIHIHKTNDTAKTFVMMTIADRML